MARPDAKNLRDALRQAVYRGVTAGILAISTKGCSPDVALDRRIAGLFFLPFLLFAVYLALRARWPLAIEH